MKRETPAWNQIILIDNFIRYGGLMMPVFKYRSDGFPKMKI